MNSTRTNSIFFISALALTFSATIPCHRLTAEDVVVVRRADGKETRRIGEIIDWKGSKITLDSNGRSRTINASEVKRIDTAWPQQLATARKLLAENDLAGAATAYQAALSTESRPWVKAIIGAELLQIYDLTDNHKQAIIQFLKIQIADNSTRFFHLIPLAWSISEQNIPAAVELKGWLGGDNVALRLIAASWLLSRGKNNDAVDALEQLASHPDKRIAQLASAQLWRDRVFSSTENDVQRWQRQLENIQPELRAGPLVLLATAQNRNGQTDAAAISLMKVRILHSDKKLLSAYALYLCGNIINESGQTERAKAIWRELTTEYPASQFAPLAGNKL